MKYRLYYWPGIQGRGEFVRLALEEGGASYVDVAGVPESRGGGVPAILRMLAARGVAAIDINMGCPVRKVCKVGGGSAMMTELAKTAALVKGMVDALKIPVTAKMRLGWDDDNLTAPDLARAL